MNSKLQVLAIPSGKPPTRFPDLSEEGIFPSDEEVSQWAKTTRQTLQGRGYHLTLEGLVFWVRETFPVGTSNYLKAKERLSLLVKDVA